MKENKTKRVTFRVTEEEYKRLEELAYGSYRLISVYCRDCVFGKKITVIPGVDDAAKQLRHIGNNLNQLTWRVNEGTITAIGLAIKNIQKASCVFHKKLLVLKQSNYLL